jgi:putative membrane protein
MKKILILTIALVLPSVGVLAKPAGLNDSQIIAIVIAANQADLSIGHLVRSKSSDDEVSFFAQSMVTDHSINLESVAELIIELKIKPHDSPVSQNLIVKSMENITNLNSLDQTEFHKTYINQEVIFHEQVLATIDSLLIPNTKNVKVKRLLDKIRPAFASHLNHAKRVQEYLSHQKH